MSSTIESDKGYQDFVDFHGSPPRVTRSTKYAFMLGSDVRGMSLEDYSKQVPPGWMAHMSNYPLKLYKEKLALWMRITDLDEEKQGPTILGRIKGPAYRIIMQMQVPRQPDETHDEVWYVTGDEGVSAKKQPKIPHKVTIQKFLSSLVVWTCSWLLLRNNMES